LRGAANNPPNHTEDKSMKTITTKVVVTIFYKDWGSGAPIVKGFPHGMPSTEAAAINADLLAFIRS
jgi:hypothetical protein